MDFELEILPLPVPPPKNTNTILHTICDNNNNMNMTTNNTSLNLNLQQQAMLNQFVSIAGCSFDQGLYLLSSSNWQYQAALNAFFDETSIFNSSNQGDNRNQINPNIFTNMNSNCINSISSDAPSNTPVTPPNLDYLEKAFSQLNSSLNENPTTSSKQTIFGFNNCNDYTSDFNNNESSSKNASLDHDMMQMNPVVTGKKSNQMPFSEQTYRDSARFNFYNN